MAWCMVTPASRGIGFALTRHLLSTTNVPVLATARKDTSGVKSNILDGLKDVDSDRLTVLELDVTGMYHSHVNWPAFHSIIKSTLSQI